MLQLTVNGEPKQLLEPCALAQALPVLGFEGACFAVAVNGGFVPRGNYEQFKLSGGEALEILSPMQGG